MGHNLHCVYRTAGIFNFLLCWVIHCKFYGRPIRKCKRIPCTVYTNFSRLVDVPQTYCKLNFRLIRSGGSKDITSSIHRAHEQRNYTSYATKFYMCENDTRYRDENVPKWYNKILFLNCSQHFGNFKPQTVSECCLIKLLSCILL